MRQEFLPFFPARLGEQEIAEVVDTLRSSWITTGPKTKKFEQQFAEYHGSPAALALSSCTAGLHLALVAHGIGPGDEVITTPMTFAATVNVIEHVGATPVLVDVEPDTLNINPELVEQAITPRTKAILPVHYAGHPVELDAVHDLAGRYELAVIEDAAHAIGASFRGRPIGSGRHLTSFSFYATKNITTAEGGMLTGDEALVERARALSLHGMSRDAWKRFSAAGSWFYEVQAPGFKYNMTDIQASLGIWQLKKLANFQRRRREVARMYTEAFRDVRGLETPTCRPHVDQAWHLYVLRLRPGALAIGRNEFIEQLKARQIGTSVHFIPIHLHPYYRDKYGYAATDFPVALDNYQRMLSLPLHQHLSDQDVMDVIEAVLDVVQSNRRRAAA